MRKTAFGLGLFAVLAVGLPLSAETLDLPKEAFPGGNPATVMSRYWLSQAERAFERWQKDYEARTTPEAVAEYQKRMHEKFVEAVGGLPERTPLNARVTGTIQRRGYRVEKVLFESQPKHFVTALMFLPQAEQFKPPYPGVLVPCGHAMKAKGHEEYQSMGALLALNGIAALVFDPIDQGERGQYLGEGGWPKLWGTRAHSLVGIGSTLLGRNTARFEIWDAMRGIDYLQSRPEVDPKRIGCTGNSGGGTQTSYAMALDARIQAAAPSCYLCGFPALLRTIGPQDAEQNIFGQIGFGMDHADYVTMRAPRPVLFCVATKDFFDIRGAWDTFRYAKRLYTRLGFAERVDLLENDAGHNYNTTQREGVVRWMARWLLQRDAPITEPKIELLSDQECQVTPEGQTLRLAGARSVYDFNADLENQLAPRRAERWTNGDRGERLAVVRKLAGMRALDALPPAKKVSFGTVQRKECRIERLVLELADGLMLPALLFEPTQGKARGVALYLHEQGKAADAGPGGPIEKLVREGIAVLAPDLSGTGQTQSTAETKDVYTAYLLGRSYVGLRAEEILVAARWARDALGDADGVDLFAVGQVGIPALHAAAVEPGLFPSVKLTRTLKSWSGVIPSRLTQVQGAEIVHGALTEYDLPDLAASLGSKLTVEAAVQSGPPPAPAKKPARS